MKSRLPIFSSQMLLSIGLIFSSVACGGGEEPPALVQPSNIQIGVAIQQYVHPLDSCGDNCPKPMITFNYIGNDNLHASDDGNSALGCSGTGGRYLSIGDRCLGKLLTEAQQWDGSNIDRPRWVQHQFKVQKFNGLEISPHFEVGFDLGDIINSQDLGISVFLSTRDHLDIDESIDGTYNLLLCLNALTGEFHEATEGHIINPGEAIGGLWNVPYMTCF